MTHSYRNDFDIIVAGGGMVGLAQALLLAHQLPKLRIAVVENFAMDASAPLQPSFDARATAISAASADLLELLGVWQDLHNRVQPIHTVHVSDRGHLGKTEFSEVENNHAPLGYVVENAVFGRQLMRACNCNAQITALAPAQVEAVQPLASGVRVGIAREGERRNLHCELVIIADGADSGLRRQLGVGVHSHDYQQVAVIANVVFSEPHGGRAFERFTEEGPLAVLPMLDEIPKTQMAARTAVVWTRPEAMMQETLSWNDAEFLLQLQQRFGYRLGTCARVGARSSYWLRKVFAQEQIRRGIVFMGNAAHFLHPVAGQGFNLAVRDCAQLAAVLAQADRGGQALGSLPVLQRYEEAQRLDQALTSQLSHNFIRIFASQNPAVQLGRNLGLLGMSLLPGVKQHLFGHMMGKALPRAALSLH